MCVEVTEDCAGRDINTVEEAVLVKAPLRLQIGNLMVRRGSEGASRSNPFRSMYSVETIIQHSALYVDRSGKSRGQEPQFRQNKCNCSLISGEAYTDYVVSCTEYSRAVSA